MIQRLRWRAWALRAISLAIAAGVPAASAATHPCAAVADDAQRLACYDAAFERPSPPVAVTASKAESPSPARAATPAQAALPTQAALPAQAAPTATADDFGLTEHAKRSLDPDPEKRKPASLTAGVTAVTRGRDTRFVLTLDNGQVWRQIETLSQARVSVGDTVTIREASLGSFLLVTSNRIATRVRRVR